MTGPVRGRTDTRRQYLSAGWEIAAAPAGTISAPDDARLTGLQWLAAPACGTAAAVLRARGEWELTRPRRFDAEDWWYRLRFDAPGATMLAPWTLGFDGLATVADVWLNGVHLLRSENMYLAHAVQVPALREGGNELLLKFHSLDALLQTRRPRPRWRTPMVEHQQLRWFRTTLLGRTPGWSPPVAPVGPWRPVWLESPGLVELSPPRIDARVEGSAGVVEISCRVQPRTGLRLGAVALVVTRKDRRSTATLVEQDGTFRGRMAMDAVDLWWPHTHGEPALYAAKLEISVEGPEPQLIICDLGNLGFRTISLDTSGDGFTLQVNGVRVFCRGACWTPPDVVQPGAFGAAAVALLSQIVAAGMNMVRLSGTMVYEGEAFLDACDARGVLIWQDFMFASMDYPGHDPAFAASAARECRQLIAQLRAHPSAAVLCGNSECEQQAAMWGMPRELWSDRLFAEVIPAAVAEQAPELIYWPSSAHGGAFPHQVDSGTASYYGVGAYLRPLTDARHGGLRFATECLGFANVPEDETLAALGSGVKAHSPQWKARSPRDLGAGWDFDDVRDHYFRVVFGADPLQVRYAAHERYLQLSRMTSAEVMSAAFRDWRRAGSRCGGALIWFLRDLWPGAGWGLVDAHGIPKAPFYALSRLLQPQAVLLTDEGCNGVFAHVINDAAAPLEATLEIALVHTNGVQVTRYRRPVSVAARGQQALPAVSLMEGFADLSNAYRFGPPAYEAVIARLFAADGCLLQQDFHFPAGHDPWQRLDSGLAARAELLADGDARVTVSCTRLASFVILDVPGFRAADQYFHVAPDLPQEVRLSRLHVDARLAGEVRSLGCGSSSAVKLVSGADGRG